MNAIQTCGSAADGADPACAAVSLVSLQFGCTTGSLEVKRAKVKMKDTGSLRPAISSLMRFGKMNHRSKTEVFISLSCQCLSQVNCVKHEDGQVRCRDEGEEDV